MVQYLIERCRRLKVHSSEVYTLLDGIFIPRCNDITIINQEFLYNILQFIKPPVYHWLDFHNSVREGKDGVLRLWFAKNYGGVRFLTQSNILAPAVLRFSNKSLKRMTSLFQGNFKISIQVHVHTDSEILDSLGFPPVPSVPFHFCFSIPFFFFMLLTSSMKSSKSQGFHYYLQINKF